MLLHRLKDDRTMDDGVAWSAQADFLARLADWEGDADSTWPLQRAERSALVALNVPHFVLPCDAIAIDDPAGCARIAAISGLERTRARLDRFDAAEIAWQIEVIRQNVSFVSQPARADDEAPQPLARPDVAVPPPSDAFRAEADGIAAEI